MKVCAKEIVNTHKHVRRRATIHNSSNILYRFASSIREAHIHVCVFNLYAYLHAGILSIEQIRVMQLKMRPKQRINLQNTQSTDSLPYTVHVARLRTRIATLDACSRVRCVFTSLRCNMIQN